MLIAAGANVNAYSRVCDVLHKEWRYETPLITLARTEQSHSLLTFLLESGANIDSGAQDVDGFNALGWATYHNNISMMELLLAHGANINQVDNRSRSPLFIAGRLGHELAAQVLLKWGANMNRRALFNDTALMNAVIRRKSGVASILIQAGADVTGKDSDGIDLLTWACLTDDVEICQLLVLAGATITQQHVDDLVSSADPSIRGWMEAQLLVVPSSLLQLCRLGIREHLCQNNNNKSITGLIGNLPLPSITKDYLRLIV